MKSSHFWHPLSPLKTVLTIASLFLIGGSEGFSQETVPWWKQLFSGTQQTEESQPEWMPPTDRQPAVAPVDLAPPVEPPTEEAKEVRDAGNEIPRPTGSVTLDWDGRASALDSAWHATPHPLKGYRIQVFSGSLQNAREVRSSARKWAGDTPVYLSSMAPNYRVTIGDYRSRWDALKAQEDWLDKYPTAIVIPMEINLPELEIGAN